MCVSGVSCISRVSQAYTVCVSCVSRGSQALLCVFLGFPVFLVSCVQACQAQYNMQCIRMQRSAKHCAHADADTQG